MSHKEVLVCGEILDGCLDPKTYEILGIGGKLANDIGANLTAVLIGDRIDQLADELAYFGTKKVFKIEDPVLANYSADLWVKILEDLCGDISPSILLMPHSLRGMEVAPRLAFRLNTVLTTDCIGLELDREDGLLLRTKAVYGGNAVAVFKSDGKPQFVTVREKVMKPADRTSAKGEIINVKPDINESAVRIESIKIVREEAVELDKADAIIAGGRGIGGNEGFKDLEVLANLFKESFERVEIGTSRPPVDSGWVSSNRQVGLTGEKVSPVLYIAIGISGAIQHLVGITQAKKIVAINTDSESNIFNVADYGVVGDYKAVIPAFKRKWIELL
jgi:electron transfer flavoprotein alpha subunit